MPRQNVVAIILDCDDTLCSDTTTFLLKQQGIKVDAFWNNVDRMVKRGWDPPLAYMKRILDLNAEGKTKYPITQEYLTSIGAKLKWYPGVPKFFRELSEYVASDKLMAQNRVELEFYVISSGLEDVIRGSKIAQYLNGFCGCSFDLDSNGEIAFPRTIVTFTEKTKYVFAINKGISFNDIRKDPYAVNDAIENGKRRVPFCNMIYIGDGPSDIPCLSTIRTLGGKGVGVYGHGTIHKAYQLARGSRTTVGPYSADYRHDSELRKMLEAMIRGIGVEIHRRTQESVIRSPHH